MSAPFQSLGVLIGRFHAIEAALIDKGLITEKELAAHYPKTEEEMRRLFNMYIAPFVKGD